jgi:tetratricopeptide (TPR) repeat protein
MSFAKGLIERGDYEEAIAAATRAIDEGDAGPEPLFDRATAYELVERYADAVTDFESAIEKNKAEKEIDPFMLDDAYFSAVLAAAQNEDVAKGVARLERYKKVLPAGAHLAEVSDWQKRLRGELPSLLDKTKDIGAL